ncbi:hypothetical protein C8T65DRAFT_829112 [Cerioporus squamosus]|nr:hypothetical protein C8T65DRAFT_829112 [Cerioporus squamosus]
MRHHSGARCLHAPRLSLVLTSQDSVSLQHERPQWSGPCGDIISSVKLPNPNVFNIHRRFDCLRFFSDSECRVRGVLVLQAETFQHPVLHQSLHRDYVVYIYRPLVVPCSRYSVRGTFLTFIIGRAAVNTDMARSCDSLPIFEGVCTMLPYLSWAVFSAFRVYALTDCNKCLATLVFILHATFLVPDVYENAAFQNVNLPAPYYCSRASPPGSIVMPLLLATRAASLLGEAIVVGVTITKTYGWLSVARDMTRRRPIAEVLLTNGVLCFSIPLLLNALTLALTFVGLNHSDGTALTIGQCVIGYRDVITSILISRFLLDLGTCRDDVYASDAPSSRYHSSHLSFVLPPFESARGGDAEDD